MRTEKEIYDLVLNFAFQDERIRIVTLEGSRTNVNIPKDNLQDYDITFFVIDMGEFLKSDDWLSVFGNRMMMQKPEDMELFPPEEKGFSYIMLFDDGVKIDLTLLPVSMLEEYLTRDKLVKIMLDKDNMIKTEIVPTDEDYYIKCPTERKFDDCCNEFWNVATYVSKGLLRGEILFAIDHMNEVLRHELLRMISWYVGTEKGFNFSLGKNYKFLDKHISKELWDNLLNTYSMSSYEEMWKSFDLCLCLFKKISKKVADSLGYNYPDYDENVTKYLETQKRISNKYLYFENFSTDTPFDMKNPRYVLSLDGVDKILEKLVVNRPYSLTIEDFDNAELVKALLYVEVLQQRNGKLGIGVPVFVEKDAEALKELSKCVANSIATELIAHKNQIVSIAQCIDNGYPVERNLYHILCGYIFDGLMFDYLEENDLVTTSCVHASGLDYLVILYEDTASLNEYSDLLLCSYNRLTINGKGFVSFGDSDGSRKDLYRYKRQKELNLLSEQEEKYICHPTEG